MNFQSELMQSEVMSKVDISDTLDEINQFNFSESDSDRFGRNLLSERKAIDSYSSTSLLGPCGTNTIAKSSFSMQHSLEKRCRVF
jgi:hypothetical protein